MMPLLAIAREIEVAWPTQWDQANPFFWVAAGSLVFLGVTAMLGFYWAAQNGQFEKLDEASREIFGADEPIGMVTDRFPEKKRK
ncbi:MAG: cbb3-type cytochrome oxidase assembly protein CcoS [Verrucomicrobiae bacterium]|nr:cbb3-type cytochrome oxidase assembly protein CcoS [Verrucomicrobiae bacterium]